MKSGSNGHVRGWEVGLLSCFTGDYARMTVDVASYVGAPFRGDTACEIVLEPKVRSC